MVGDYSSGVQFVTISSHLDNLVSRMVIFRVVSWETMVNRAADFDTLKLGKEQSLLCDSQIHSR